MRKPWQMISHNGRAFNPRTITLSTVEMPDIAGLDLGYAYESCLFSNRESTVLERYDNLVDAVKGHAKWCGKLGLNV